MKKLSKKSARKTATKQSKSTLKVGGFAEITGEYFTRPIHSFKKGDIVYLKDKESENYWTVKNKAGRIQTVNSSEMIPTTKSFPLPSNKMKPKLHLNIDLGAGAKTIYPKCLQTIRTPYGIIMRMINEDKDQWVRVVGRNGEVLMNSETVKSKASVLKNVTAVAKIFKAAGF